MRIELDLPDPAGWAVVPLAAAGVMLALRLAAVVYRRCPRAWDGFWAMAGRAAVSSPALAAIVSAAAWWCSAPVRHAEMVTGQPLVAKTVTYKDSLGQDQTWVYRNAGTEMLSFLGTGAVGAAGLVCVGVLAIRWFDRPVPA